MPTAADSLRDVLRGLKVLQATPAPFDPDKVPAEPHQLFADWLHSAIRGGQSEPHAMTLSTVDTAGEPDARTLICKNVDARGWWFASSANSMKGAQLAAQPAVALTFYWPAVGRQVRVRGTAVTAGAPDSAADFLARGQDARIAALVGNHEQHDATATAIERAVAAARDRVEKDPGLVDPAWTAHVVEPRSVEFWQADPRRLHTRVRYERDAAWTTRRLWP